MNNDQVKQLIQGIGLMTELWMITYQGFKAQGLNDADAATHTKAFMSVIIDSVGGFNGDNDNQN